MKKNRKQRKRQLRLAATLLAGVVLTGSAGTLSGSDMLYRAVALAADKKADKEADQKTDKKTNQKADKKTNQKADKKTDQKAEKKAAKKTDKKEETKGRKKGGWIYKKINGKKTRVGYRYGNGKKPTGIREIGGKLYFFSRKYEGQLVRRKKAGIFTVDNDRYYVKKDGSVFGGWVAYKEKELYYFSKKTGKMMKNKTVNEVRLSNDGKAVWDLDASVRYKSIKLLDQITDREASKEEQLKDAFYYIGNRRNFSYATIYPDLSDKSWAKKYANEMLSSHKGNCYGFACTFAAVANAIGYKPDMMTMRMRGPRDHAADGYTRHCQVRIDGYYYDPELHWYGGFNIYHRSSPSISNKSKKSHSYCAMDGEIGADSTISQGTKKFEEAYVSKRDGSYFYYVGKKQKPGLFFIDGSLYYFKKKKGMSRNAYKKMQKLIREGSPWKSLRVQLVKPRRKKVADSCYAPDGVDVIYQFKHVRITTFKPYEGEEIVINVEAAEA